MGSHENGDGAIVLIYEDATRQIEVDVRSPEALRTANCHIDLGSANDADTALVP